MGGWWASTLFYSHFYISYPFFLACADWGTGNDQVFTIRTYFLPITEMAKEPYAPGRLASAVRSWGDDVAKYKGRERWQDVLLGYLDKEHERQMAEGLEPEKEEYVYPY